MNRTELKNWAKEKIKGHIGELFVALLIVGILTNLTIGGHISVDGSNVSLVLQWLIVSLPLFKWQISVGILIDLSADVSNESLPLLPLVAP